MMARISLLGIGFACGVCTTGAFAQWVLPPQGRPVTTADISGKTICWDNRHNNTYAADGKFSNNLGHRSKWSVPRPGIIKIGYKERETEALPDGQLHMHWFKLYRGNGDKNIDHWGRPCG